jgi:hypothetical protein
MGECMITNSELKVALDTLMTAPKPETEQDEAWLAGATAVVKLLIERAHPE